MCYDLVLEYQSKENETFSYRATSLELGKVVNNDANEFLEFMAKKKSRTIVMKTKLDYYLEEDNLPVTQEFDILSWWKTNGLKFPTLQAIARDVLAIPITIVAYESAFSTSGQKLTSHLSRLHHITIEHLMCTRSWIRNSNHLGKLLKFINICC